MASQCGQSGRRQQRLLREDDRRHGKQTENGYVSGARRAKTSPLDGAARARGMVMWESHRACSPPCCWTRDGQRCNPCRTIVLQRWAQLRRWNAITTCCPHPLGSPHRPPHHRSSRRTSRTEWMKMYCGDDVDHRVRRQAIGKGRTCSRRWEGHCPDGTEGRTETGQGS